jgi:hypothetical protein
MQELLDQLSSDALILLFWSDFDRRKKNLVTGSSNGDAANPIAILFNDQERQRLETFIERAPLPSFIPTPGVANVLAHGFAMQPPEVFTVMERAGAKADLHADTRILLSLSRRFAGSKHDSPFRGVTTERFGASVGDIISQNFFGDFLLAAAFHGDTRYVRLRPSDRLRPRVFYDD